MNLNSFDAFTHFETEHCVTGSLRHIYSFNHFDISEDMLLGIGEGLGFIYWHPKGQAPFIGGRSTPKPGFENTAGKHTGVQITAHSSTSAYKSEQILLEMLTKNMPVMLQVDMGFLPYFDFNGQEYHFGGHVVVVCGFDAISGQVLIADRDKDLHCVGLRDLAKARGSTYKPFPPKNKWFSFDFTNKRNANNVEIFEAIYHQAELMLNPPISNMGIKGMRKAADLVPQWNKSMNPEALKWALFNAYILISPVGGSGGGLFRYMFSRFLLESARFTGNSRLADASNNFQKIADHWAYLGEWFKIISDVVNMENRLGEAQIQLAEIADLEEAAWMQLASICKPELKPV